MSRNGRKVRAYLATLIAFGCGEDVTATAVDDSSGTTTAGSDGMPAETSTTIDEVTTGESTGEMTTTAADETTTETSLCGNGEVDPGEECDDGNDDWLDECRPDCTRSFESLWTHSYDGPGNLFDAYAAVVVDPAGTIYVTGSHVVEGSRRDLLVKAYTPDGREGWSFSYDGGIDEHDVGHAIAWHPDGDLIVCGGTTTADDGEDAILMRLSPGADAPVWSRGYRTADEPILHETFTDLAIDHDGNIVTIGSQGTAALSWDIVLQKYDADGELSWSVVHGDVFGGPDFGYDVAVDDEGNIAALGRIRVAQGLNRTWVRSHDTDGQERWTYTSGSDGSPNWFANGVAVDAEGQVVLTGSQSAGAVVAKLDATGDVLWRQELSNGAVGTRVLVAPTGNIVVAGNVNPSNEGFDVWAAGFDAAGEPRWGFTYGNAEAKLDDWAQGVAVDQEGDVIIVGIETVLGQQRNGWIGKIRPAP